MKQLAVECHFLSIMDEKKESACPSKMFLLKQFKT